MISFEQLHSDLTSLVNTAERSLQLYAPYIVRPALTQILRGVRPSVKVSITTTWRISDVAFGASDPSIFEFCRDRGYTLYLNQRIHLKSYLADQTRLLTGSANLTSKALGLTPNANHETLIRLDNVPGAYLLHLNEIQKSATLVTSDLFQRFVEQCSEAKLKVSADVEDRQKEFDESLHSNQLFLISALPMSSSISDLYKVWRGDLTADNEIVAAARHDIVNFSLHEKFDLDFDQFKIALAREFFKHPFIQALCEFIDEPKRFGAIKEWVQQNCTNVPVPSRRSLTENVQVLYQWLKLLGADKFEVRRPNHSEIISPRKSA